MEKDFHFAVTCVVGRLAGFEHEPALVIATSAQYVDDTVSEGTIRFDTGEQYRRISSAHEKWGVHEYRWSCVAGTKNHPVRLWHKALEGKIFRSTDRSFQMNVA
jgi:hypothetical protein